jgi:RNA polymerase sigma-70 factor (ECF subfamily)
MLGDEDSALDALQDVFAKVVAQGSLSVEHPSSYLYTAATRICLDKLRSAPVRHETQDDLLLHIASSEDFEEQVSARRILDFVFRRHEASTKVIAVLHFVDGLTLEEVAEQVGLSLSGVRKRLDGLKSKASAWAARNRQGDALFLAQAPNNKEAV